MIHLTPVSLSHKVNVESAILRNLICQSENSYILERYLLPFLLVVLLLFFYSLLSTLWGLVPTPAEVFESYFLFNISYLNSRTSGQGLL